MRFALEDSFSNCGLTLILYFCFLILETMLKFFYFSSKFVERSQLNIERSRQRLSEVNYSVVDLVFLEANS